MNILDTYIQHNASVILHLIIYIGTVVYFNQSEYRVNENGGSAQPAIQLINIVSSDITVRVKSKDITAKGE